MRKFKKVLASILAGTLVLSNAVPVLAAQDASSLSDGTAYLNINNSDWQPLSGLMQRLRETAPTRYR